MRTTLGMTMAGTWACVALACATPAASADGPRSRQRVQTHANTPASAPKANDATQTPRGATPGANALTDGTGKIYLNFINGPAEALERQLALDSPLITGRVVLFTEPNLGFYPKLWKGRWVHGGTPVEAHLPTHLAQVRRDVERLIPDPDWDGFAVIDYETWRPLWHLGVADVVKDRVRNIVQARNPGVSGARLEPLAAAAWDEAAMRFMNETIDLCKELRPNATWGFFGWPKIGTGKKVDDLDAWIESQRVLLEHADAIYPEVYARRISTNRDNGTREYAPRGAVKNHLKRMILWSRRFAGDRPVLAYASLRYNSDYEAVKSQPLSQEDLETMIRTPLEAGADGVILWAATGTPGNADFILRQTRDRVVPLAERLLGADSTSIIGPGDGSTNAPTGSAGAPNEPNSSRRRRAAGG